MTVDWELRSLSLARWARWVAIATAVAVAVAVSGCGGGKALLRSADDYARLAGQTFKGRPELSGLTEGQIKQRAAQALAPVSDAQGEELSLLVDTACTAYDLSKGYGKAYAQQWINKNAQDPAEVKRLMDNFETLDTSGQAGAFLVCELDF
jgi:hypothetical protein